MRKKIAPDCRWLMKNKCWQLTMFFALLCALFLPDSWILLDRPDNSDLDVLLTLVLVLFIAELSVQSVGSMRTYWGSFFFWMDCIGAVSLLFDLSYIGIMARLTDHQHQDVSNNVIIMRAARIAKLGARAGRFTKLVKLLRFLPGMSQDVANQQVTAKVISARLLTALSTRVSCLIVVMVIVMPFFNLGSFPTQDWSMLSWMSILETAGLQRPESLPDQLRLFEKAYDELSYFPYLVTLDFPGVSATSWESSRGPPLRSDNIMRLMKGAHVKCWINFTSPSKIDAAMNIALILFIMALMVLFSLGLSNSVSRVVLAPLENLLAQVQLAAKTVFKQVTDLSDMVGEEEADADNSSDGDSLAPEVFGFDTETALLEKVVEKLAVLAALMVQRGVDLAEVSHLTAEDRQIFDHYATRTLDLDRGSCRDSILSNVDGEDARLEAAQAQRAMIQSSGLSLELLDSWNLNPMEIDKARCHAAAMFFLGPHNHGISFDPVVMAEFLRAAEGCYHAMPYHNWFHAVDVTHAVYFLMQTLSSEAYLSGAERYALLASAICHDLGHAGVNNPFLIETAHELALRYNDNSPLENMHCATLFEIVAKPRNNIFETLNRKDFQDARKMCIEAILHTDAKKHFDMIREVSVLYEVNETTFSSHQAFRQDRKAFPQKAVLECLRQAETRQLLRKLILHTADISNPMKPHRICRVWAMKILEEMFSQGDRELELGIPVQALNDREKVNRAFSQVGFIEFLVAPLAFAVVKVLPPFDVCLAQLIENAKKWTEVWANETQPGEEERRAAEERAARLEKRYLSDW